MKKILASALAAAMILANVNVFAEQKVEKSHLLQDDFSDFKNGGNGSDNNRIDQWRIEGEDGDGNKTPREEHLAVEDFGEMKNALAMKNRVQILRGGRDWNEDKHVQPGETVVMEYDIYATSDAKFIFGVHSAKNTAYAEDASGHLAFMYLKPNDENVYIFPTQNRSDGTGIKFSGVTFKRDEVNHVKAEYTINSDVSVGTTDTLVMTVTNSAGTFTGTLNPDYRKQSDNNMVTGIRGINFWKDDKTGNVYLDNIEIYEPTDGSVPELVEENYAEFSNGDGIKYTDFDEIAADASALTLTFDSKIKSADGAVKITYGKNKEVPVTVSAEGYTVKAAIGSSLIPGFEYTVSIDSSKVIGTSGNAMKEDKSFKFTVAGSEESGDVVDGYVRNYCFEEDFSDFKNGGNGSDNNRIEQWRIEGEDNDGNATPREEHLTVEDFGEMKNALAMKNRNQILRGGRDWSSDKHIQPGETMVIEYDIYATSDAKFIFGVHSAKNTAYAEDAGGQSAFMFLKPDDENVYIFTSQNRGDGTNNKFSGVIFKRDEVNHVKAEYAVNGDVSVGTKDTLTMTVTNSAGTFTGTLNPDYRQQENVYMVTGIRGINFWKDDKTGDVYLDNIKVYLQYEDITPKVSELSFVHSSAATETDPKTVDADVNEIKMTFNTAMKYAAEYFDLTDSKGNRVSYTTSYSKGGTVMNIALPNMLKNDETYTLSVSAGALSKAGNAMSGDYTYTFKTNAGGEMVIESFDVSESINESANTTTVTAGAELVKTFEGKKQYSLYIMAFDENGKLVDIGYKAITMDSFGKGDFSKEITVANQDKVKTIKAVLCTYPTFKIVDIKTITR